jgi:hypothetical protein
MSNGSAKQVVVAGVSILVIAASLGWICFTQFAEPKTGLVLHKGIGEVMAEETHKLLDRKGKVVVVAVDPGKAPELRTQLETFRETLAKLGGIVIKDTVFLDTENKPKYGTGRGLSARRFVRIAKKSADVDGIVSFVGAPNLSESDFAELEKIGLPKFIAESGSAAKLKRLFDKKVLQVAIVGRYQFPAPNKNDPRNAREWFEKRFQIVTADSAGSLPGPEGE